MKEAEMKPSDKIREHTVNLHLVPARLDANERLCLRATFTRN
jgi:hypothetical protein